MEENMNLEFKRGDVIYVASAFTDNEGFPTTRPAIIISNDDFNTYSDNLTVVYMRKNTPSRRYPSHLNINDSITYFAAEPKGMATAWVLCETITTVSKKRVCKSGIIGHVSYDKMREISETVMSQLDLRE